MSPHGQTQKSAKALSDLQRASPVSIEVFISILEGQQAVAALDAPAPALPRAPSPRRGSQPQAALPPKRKAVGDDLDASVINAANVHVQVPEKARWRSQWHRFHGRPWRKAPFAMVTELIQTFPELFVPQRAVRGGRPIAFRKKSGANFPAAKNSVSVVKTCVLSAFALLFASMFLLSPHVDEGGCGYICSAGGGRLRAPSNATRHHSGPAGHRAAARPLAACGLRSQRPA